MSKTVLITGANKGIGFEIARQLGEKGFHVFLSARNSERGAAATQALQRMGISAEFVLMDVGNTASIRDAFKTVGAQIDRLDVLINNAGVLSDWNESLFSISEEQIHNTININTLGVLFVTRIFEPLLQKGSRVINVSSGAGKICGGMGTWAPIYSISKTAENAVTIQLAHALKSKGVAVNAVGPGWVRTDMGGAGASRSVQQGAETPVWLATDSPLSLSGKFIKDKKETSW